MYAQLVTSNKASGECKFGEQTPDTGRLGRLKDSAAVVCLCAR